MKIKFTAFLFLIVSTSVSHADELCGKIASINISQSAIIWKNGEETKLGSGIASGPILTTALANDLTVCIEQNTGRLISISK